jgi:glycerophosphoryl diester phosphodiesterase
MSRLQPAFWAKPFAHRGLHGAGRPENSLAAIEAAVDGGYGIEIDIQPSADGEAMVFHDYTLERLCGDESRIERHSTESLRLTQLADSTEIIPTLAEALALVRGRAPIMIEIKDQSGRFTATDGSLERRVCEALREADCVDSCAVMSFNPFSANHVRQTLPEVVRGVVSYDFRHPSDAHLPSGHRQDLASMRWFEEVGGEFISYGATSFPSPRIAEIRGQGVPVFCWTIRSEQQAQAALKHCDQITFEGYLPEL